MGKKQVVKKVSVENEWSGRASREAEFIKFMKEHPQMFEGHDLSVAECMDESESETAHLEVKPKKKVVKKKKVKE